MGVWTDGTHRDGEAAEGYISRSIGVDGNRVSLRGQGLLAD